MKVKIEGIHLLIVDGPAKGLFVNCPYRGGPLMGGNCVISCAVFGHHFPGAKGEYFSCYASGEEISIGVAGNAEVLEKAAENAEG